jgi:CDP-diacylglycerol--glycerol-3-phosphate 3-phosphatidyltransferase/cardiolipin synthase
MSQGTPGSGGEQGHRSRSGARITAADLLTLSRIPLAVGFVLAGSAETRLVILAVVAVTDLLDGAIARRLGSSRFGTFIDPVADKLFMAAAFLVVVRSSDLHWYEIAGVLLRDIVATIAFVVTAGLGRAAAIPARLGGKAVTLAQCLTLVAFLTESPLLRPLAWATAAIGLYAIWDYNQAAATSRRALGD